MFQVLAMVKPERNEAFCAFYLTAASPETIKALQDFLDTLRQMEDVQTAEATND